MAFEVTKSPACLHGLLLACVLSCHMLVHQRINHPSLSCLECSINHPSLSCLEISSQSSCHSFVSITKCMGLQPAMVAH
eukprot:868931-Amphidinium_carterae.1